MKILKAFNKTLGYILCGVLVIFIVCFLIGMLALSVYLMLMSWVEIPWKTTQPALDLPLDTKIFTTFCGVMMLFVILGFTYMMIDDILNPSRHSTKRIVPLSLRPKPPQQTEKTKPILP